MFFWTFNKWRSSVKKVLNGKMSVQTFVNVNERKILWYSTPFLSNENGGYANALQSHESDNVYFPVFTTSAGLKEHMKVMGCAEYIVIKGDMKSALSSLDCHPALREWGVVVDPLSLFAVEIPPQMRVQPKCLR